MKDPIGLKYHRLLPEQFCVLEHLDGKQSLAKIRASLQTNFPGRHLELADIQQIVTELYDKGLLYALTNGQGPSLVQRKREQNGKKLRQTLKSLLFLRIPGWDPERTLAFLLPLVRWMFHRWAACLASLFVLVSLLFLATQFDDVRRRLPEFQQFFGWPNVIYLWLTLAAAKIIHEFGHGLSCKYYGGECHQMGLMLLVFSPALYCDVSDAWMLRNKWQRIIISAAGMYIEVLISAAAIFAWWNTKPGLLNHLCLNVFFVTTVSTILFNANPLMRYDGYYILSDFLEIPNLREKSLKQLRDWFGWYFCLGIEPQRDPFMPQRGRAWFILYAVAAFVYRWLIVFGIAMFLYAVLKPYRLQSIGITLAIISVAGMFVGMIWTVYRMVTAPRIDPLDLRKITLTLGFAIMLLAGALLIPIPWLVDAPVILEPHDVHHIHIVTPGRLLHMSVSPREQVEAGQVVAVLGNDQLQDQYEDLLLERLVQQERVETMHALDDVAGQAVATETLDGLNERIVEFEKRLALLTLRAPIAGSVVPPPALADPSLQAIKEQLPHWTGTPLEERNRRCLLEENTQLLSIAPDHRYHAIIYVDQAHRNDVEVRQHVLLKFESLPYRTFSGRIEEIAAGHEEFVPPVLSNKTGGPLPTVTDAQGRERLTSIVYRATLVLENDTHLLRTGLRGRARLYLDRRTAVSWIWRWLRRTFLFHL